MISLRALFTRCDHHGMDDILLCDKGEAVQDKQEEVFKRTLVAHVNDPVALRMVWDAFLQQNRQDRLILRLVKQSNLAFNDANRADQEGLSEELEADLCFCSHHQTVHPRSEFNKCISKPSGVQPICRAGLEERRAAKRETRRAA